MSFMIHNVDLYHATVLITSIIWKHQPEVWYVEVHRTVFLPFFPVNRSSIQSSVAEHKSFTSRSSAEDLKW